MKKRNMKRMAAIALTGALAVAMAVPAMAAPADEATGTKQVPIVKTIYFINQKNTNVYEPNVAYNYTLRAATAAEVGDATVRDADGRTAAVKPGNAAAITKGTAVINFSSDHKVVANVDKDGTAVSEKNNFELDLDKFKEGEVVVPGVYRYIITETVGDVSLANAGVSRTNDYATTRVMDVYVSINEDGEPEATSVILAPEDDGTTPTNKDIDNGDTNGDGKVDDSDNGDNDDKKTSGFGGGDEDPTNWENENPEDKEDAGDDDPGTDPYEDNEKTKPEQTSKVSTASIDLADLKNADYYTTYNMTIKKTVTGTMGDKTKKFDFATTLANTVGNSRFTYKVADASAADTKVKTIQNVLSGSIKNGETIEFYGVPSTGDGLTAQVTETNTAAEAYTTSAKFNGTEVRKAAAVESNAKAEIAAQKLTDESDSVKNEMEVTNNLDAVSPTGVALRFAPYIAIIGAALALLGFTRRRRA